MSNVPNTNQEWQILIENTISRLPEHLIRPSADSSIPTTEAAFETDHLPQTYEVAQRIDHTLLAPEATADQIRKLCIEALENCFRTVCVRPGWVRLSRDVFIENAHAIQSQLRGPAPTSELPGIAAVVGFPEGTHSTEFKCTEAQDSLSGGATELDMVLNYDLLKNGSYLDVFNDIKRVKEVIEKFKNTTYSEPCEIQTNEELFLLKVILETSQLTQDQIIAGSVIAVSAGADFIKTSTGFLGRGASLEDVRLMKAVGDFEEKEAGSQRVRVKASGGIRTIDNYLKMVSAGAERIGASAGVKILEGLRARGSHEEGRING